MSISLQQLRALYAAAGVVLEAETPWRGCSTVPTRAMRKAAGSHWRQHLREARSEVSRALAVETNGGGL